MEKETPLPEDDSRNGFYRPLNLILWIIILTGIALTRIYSYLLFHSLVELFSIVIAAGIFIIAWNTRRFHTNSYLLVIGIAYLFVGTLDMLHTLAYTGMNVFEGYDTDLPTQLWISARYLEGVTLLIAPFLIGREVKAGLAMFAYGLLTGILLIFIFTEVFPACFVEDEGLTTFKKSSEYLIAFFLLVALALLYRKRQEFDRSVVVLLGASILFTMGSEIFFTAYTDAYGKFNMSGHLLKAISFSLIYMAIINTGLNKPYLFLFRHLALSQEAIADSELHYRNLVESSPDGILTIDPRGYIMDSNEAISRMLEYTPEELSHRNIREFAPDIVPADLISYSLSSTSGGGHLEDEFELLHRGGHTVPVWAKMVPVYNTSGILTQFTIYVRDIAERRRVDQLKDEFLGLVSHELRNPLTVILGGINTALSEREYLTEEETVQLLNDAACEAEDLSHLIGNLLEISRSQANRLFLYPEEVNAGNIIRQVVEKIADHNPSYTFEIDVPEELPDVRADQLRLERILHNLLENAVKYSPPKGRIRVISTSEKDRLIIGVQDHGDGISTEDQATLFDPFARLEKHVQDGITGTGLGLSVCKTLVEAHGGKIWVESTPGHGTTFYFSLPWAWPLDHLPG